MPVRPPPPPPCNAMRLRIGWQLVRSTCLSDYLGRYDTSVLSCFLPQRRGVLVRCILTGGDPPCYTALQPLRQLPVTVLLFISCPSIFPSAISNLPSNLESPSNSQCRIHSHACALLVRVDWPPRGRLTSSGRLLETHTCSYCIGLHGLRAF